MLTDPKVRDSVLLAVLDKNSICEQEPRGLPAHPPWEGEVAVAKWSLVYWVEKRGGDFPKENSRAPRRRSRMNTVCPAPPAFRDCHE
jgi:hypothetical protein